MSKPSNLLWHHSWTTLSLAIIVNGTLYLVFSVQKRSLAEHDIVFHFFFTKRPPPKVRLCCQDYCSRGGIVKINTVRHTATMNILVLFTMVLGNRRGAQTTEMAVLGNISAIIFPKTYDCSAVALSLRHREISWKILSKGVCYQVCYTC